jgi:hypothetical protein
MSMIILNLSNATKILKSKDGYDKLKDNIHLLSDDVYISEQNIEKTLDKMKYECKIMKKHAKNVIEWLDIHENKEIVDDIKINKYISTIMNNSFCKNIIQKYRNEILKM